MLCSFLCLSWNNDNLHSSLRNSSEWHCTTKKNPKKQQTTKKATVGIIKDGPGTGDEIHRHGWVGSCHGTTAATCESQHHQTTLWKAAVLPAYRTTKTSEQTVLYLPGTQRSLWFSCLDPKFKEWRDFGKISNFLQARLESTLPWHYWVVD